MPQNNYTMNRLFIDLLLTYSDEKYMGLPHMKLHCKISFNLGQFVVFLAILYKTSVIIHPPTKQISLIDVPTLITPASANEQL